MKKRRIAVLVAVGVAGAALVGLSAAATMSVRGDSPKPAKAAKPTPASQPTVVSKPEGKQQTPDEAVRYWTKERMRDARSLEKSLAGGSPSPSPPASGGTTTAGTSEKSAPAGEQSKRKSTPPADSIAKAPADPSGTGIDYWTQDRMDGAQPMEKTVPDDAGSGSGGAPDPPGGTTPPAIP